MERSKIYGRREFLRLSGLAAAGALLAACTPVLAQDLSQQAEQVNTVVVQGPDGSYMVHTSPMDKSMAEESMGPQAEAYMADPQDSRYVEAFTPYGEASVIDVSGLTADEAYQIFGSQGTGDNVR